MFELGATARVHVIPPPIPTFTVSPPPSGPVHVVPVVGPAGAAGADGVSIGVVTELVGTVVGLHMQDDDPHPAYDDLPSLQLLFENGLI